MLKTFGKFMLVGALNGILYFGLMYLMTTVLGVYYMMSAVVCIILQTTTTYGIHRIYVWKSKKVAIKSAINIYRFIKYCIIGVVGMLFGLGGLYMITEVWHVYYMVSLIVASFLLLVLNFLANHYWTWGENETKETKWIVIVLNKVGLMSVIKRMGVQV